MGLGDDVRIWSSRLSHFVCLDRAKEHKKNAYPPGYAHGFTRLTVAYFTHQRHATERLSRDRETRLKISQQQKHLNFMWVRGLLRAVSIVAATVLPRTAALRPRRRRTVTWTATRTRTWAAASLCTRPCEPPPSLLRACKSLLLTVNKSHAGDERRQGPRRGDDAGVAPARVEDPRLRGRRRP